MIRSPELDGSGLFFFARGLIAGVLSIIIYNALV